MQPAAAADHGRHDPALIAALVDGEPDAHAPDAIRARELVAQCERCRDLFADLSMIRAALPTSMTPRRPRAFTLTAADAQRLRSTGWRRTLGFFGSARDAFSRPLAIGFTTIGIVAMLVTASPLSFGFMGSSGAASPVLSTVGNAVPAAGGGGAAPAASAPASAEPSRQLAELGASPAASAAAAASAPAAASAAAAPAPSPEPSDSGRTAAGEPYASGGETSGVFTGSNDTDDQAGDADTDEPVAAAKDATVRTDGGLPLGIVVGGVCLIAGFGLFALRWTSRRIGAG